MILQHGIFEKADRYFYITKLWWKGEPTRAEFVEIDKGAYKKGVIRKKGEGFERSWEVIKSLFATGELQVIRGGGLTYSDSPS